MNIPIVRVIAVTHFLGVPEELLETGVKQDQDRGSEMARLIECAGRTCYDSYGKGRGSAAYHDHIKETGHGSVTEHANLTFYMEGVSRGLTHEHVRHRHAGISQRSTRYVDESETELVWHPLLLQTPKTSQLSSLLDEVREVTRKAYRLAVEEVQTFLENRGVDRIAARKQARGAARGVLPNALGSALVWTTNIRSLRNYLELRASVFADAEIRLLANAIYEAALEVVPEWFSDYRRMPCPDGIGYALETDYRKI